MNPIESFRIALDSIRVNTLRSSLTMLGIIIGVGSVIAMTSLGNGLSDLVASEIDANGSNLLYVTGTTESGFPSLTVQDGDLIIANPAVADVAYAATVSRAVDTSDGRQFTDVSAVSANYFALTSIDTLEAGSVFDDVALDKAVLGSTIAESLFPNGNALGSTITIEGTEFTVVGILQTDEDEADSGPPLPPGAPEGSRPAFFTPSEATTVYVPLAAGQEALSLPLTEDNAPSLTTIVVAVTDSDLVDEATEEVTVTLRDAHGLADDADDDFSIISQATLADTFSTITASLTLFLGAVAGISLIVGGIGIMNIMLVSVTERTREIGIRKALGARKRDIQSQFMIEALVLCLLGGSIGLLLGWGIAAVGGVAMRITATLSVSMVIIAIGFSTVVGLIFGIYPARKASQLTPIVALRYE